MTPEDLARLTEEEREWWGWLSDAVPSVRPDIWCVRPSSPTTRRSGGDDVARALADKDADLAEARQARDAAFRVLVRLGLVRHAGTWITREEADRISKDPPETCECRACDARPGSEDPP